VQVNTDDNIEGREQLIQRVEADIRDSLARFSAQITRIEIHLSDENAGKSGSNDKRCLIEARLAGRKPEAVSHEGGSIEVALNGAIGKLRRALESTLGQLTDQKGAATIRGAPGR